MTAVELSGTFVTAASASRVIQFISSPESISEVLPDVESFRSAGEVTTVKFRVDLAKGGRNLGGGYLSTAAATMKFRYSEVRKDGAVITGEGRTLGSPLRLSVWIETADEGSATRINWRASIDTGLLLKLMGREAIEGFSAETVREIISNVEKALN